MKAGVLAIAAAMAAGVTASGAAHRHAHEAFHLARGLAERDNATCGCTTIYTTIWGKPTELPKKPTTTSRSIYVPTSSPPPEVPTAYATTCPTPGAYTIPATILTLTETKTVCGVTSTQLPPGSHTYGGVTTVVKTSTVITCPYVDITTKEGKTTSTISLTTYTCPSAGTYTIKPSTTTVKETTVIVYPTPAIYTPATYTQPAVITTVTKYNVVVVCPYTEGPKPTKAPVTTQAAPKYEAPKPETPKYEAPKSEAPKYEVKVDKPKPAAPGKLGVQGDKWGITYTPYTEDTAGLCKSNDTIRADIENIAKKGFTAIRVYSTDCFALELIPQYCELHGIKMILGIFISETGIPGAQEQLNAILSWKRWDLVDLIVVGNEALHTSPPRASPSELAGFIGSCKAAFQGAGYTGPVTTAEPLYIWEQNADALCGVVDVVGMNIHPFFNADVDSSYAGEFTKGQLSIGSGLCNGKDAYNLESGWPSRSTTNNGKAIASPEDQSIAIKSILAAVGGQTIIFSYGNDGWKQPGEYGVEQYFGCSQLF